ncbi:hypothetical protein BC834DRAFT_848710, partial [Gloeopeniophorella convolvens]
MAALKTMFTRSVLADGRPTHESCAETLKCGPCNRLVKKCEPQSSTSSSRAYTCKSCHDGKIKCFPVAEWALHMLQNRENYIKTLTEAEFVPNEELREMLTSVETLTEGLISQLGTLNLGSNLPSRANTSTVPTPIDSPAGSMQSLGILRLAVNDPAASESASVPRDARSTGRAPSTRVVLLLTIFLTLFSPSMSPNYIKTIDPEDEPIQQDTRNVQTRTGIRTYERTVCSKPYQRPNNPPVHQTPTAGPSKTRTTTQGVQNQPRTARATPRHPPNYQQDDDMMVVDEEPSELPPHPQLKPMEEWLGLREDYLNILLQSEGPQSGL